MCVEQFSSSGFTFFTEIYTELHVSEKLTGQTRPADGQEFAIQRKSRDREIEDGILKVCILFRFQLHLKISTYLCKN